MRITDRDGDTLSLYTSDGDEPVLTVRSGDEIAAVYLSRDDARTLRDHLDEFLGESRKASPATMDEARALLIQVGKDLIRKGAPVDLEGDCVVFLEPSS
jgi:hypothetical protein